jgi:hypothetical protein
MLEFVERFIFPVEQHAVLAQHVIVDHACQGHSSSPSRDAVAPAYSRPLVRLIALG